MHEEQPKSSSQSPPPRVRPRGISHSMSSSDQRKPAEVLSTCSESDADGSSSSLPRNIKIRNNEKLETKPKFPGQQQTETPKSPAGGDGRKKWPCDYCTYLNFDSAAKCCLCRAPRPLQRTRIEDLSRKAFHEKDEEGDTDKARGLLGAGGEPHNRYVHAAFGRNMNE